jgi:transcriptional regulator with XRE-family HTH domain
MTAKSPTARAEATEIGQRIRARRTALGLTQSQLASMLRSRTGRPQTVSKVSQWERGESTPEPSKRPEIADALQTSALALFGEADSDETFLTRLDLLERRVAAIVRLQGLEAAVEEMVRQGRQADRRHAQDAALDQGAATAAEGRLATLRKQHEPQGKRRATGKRQADR